MVAAVNAATRTISYTPSPKYSAPSAFNSFTPPAGYVDDGFDVFDFRNGVQNRGTGRMSVAGIRGNSGLANVVAEVGGVLAQVTYAGAQPQYDGLDQVDVFIPSSLAGAGVVPIVLSIDGVTANVVTVQIK